MPHRWEQTTIKTYDQIARTWAQTHNTPGFWGEEMEKMINYVPKGKIIELGCGNGRDAQELIKFGYQYLGIDASGEMLAQAKSIASQPLFLIMDIYDIDVLSSVKFDAFWASTSLLHISKKRIGEVLTKISSILQPAGVGFISLKPGQGEEMKKEQIGKVEVSRYFAYYQLDEFAEILSRHNFTVLEKYKKNKYLCFFCQKK